MVLTVQRRYGSFALDSTNAITVQGWEATVLNGVDFEPRIDGQGSIRTRDAIDGIEVSMSGDITSGGDSSVLRARVDALVAALRNREDYLQLFSDRRLLCGPSSEIRTTMRQGTSYGMVKWDATFRSRVPTWESTSLTTSSAVVLTSATSGSGSMAATAGVAPVYPQIAITNTGASSFQGVQIVLTNGSTTKQFSMDGVAMAVGQTIVVDMYKRAIDDGVSVPFVPSGITGQYWDISPLSTQLLEVNCSAAVTISVVASWRDQFWAA